MGTNLVFDEPPVTEFAMGVMFSSLQLVRAIHVGVYWQKIRDEFPQAEQQPPIPRALETFGPASPAEQAVSPMSFGFPFPFGSDEPRNIFLSTDRSRVIQVQRDRFICNWQRVTHNDKYPGYRPVLRSEFEKRWSDYVSFLGENGLGAPLISQCEATYIDDIPQGEGWDNPSDLPKILRPWTGDFGPDSGLPDVESLSLAFNFVVPQDQGRVYVNVHPFVKPNTPRPVLRLAVNARIIPNAVLGHDVMALMDAAHDWAVKTFDRVTASEIQARWGRR